VLLRATTGRRSSSGTGPGPHAQGGASTGAEELLKSQNEVTRLKEEVKEITRLKEEVKRLEEEAEETSAAHENAILEMTVGRSPSRGSRSRSKEAHCRSSMTPPHSGGSSDGGLARSSAKEVERTMAQLEAETQRRQGLELLCVNLVEDIRRRDVQLQFCFKRFGEVTGSSPFQLGDGGIDGTGNVASEREAELDEIRERSYGPGRHNVGSTGSPPPGSTGAPLPGRVSLTSPVSIQGLTSLEPVNTPHRVSPRVAHRVSEEMSFVDTRGSVAPSLNTQGSNPASTGSPSTSVEEATSKDSKSPLALAGSRVSTRHVPGRPIGVTSETAFASSWSPKKSLKPSRAGHRKVEREDGALSPAPVVDHGSQGGRRIPVSSQVAESTEVEAGVVSETPAIGPPKAGVKPGSIKSPLPYTSSKTLGVPTITTEHTLRTKEIPRETHTSNVLYEKLRGVAESAKGIEARGMSHSAQLSGGSGQKGGEMPPHSQQPASHIPSQSLLRHTSRATGAVAMAEEAMRGANAKLKVLGLESGVGSRPPAGDLLVEPKPKASIPQVLPTGTCSSVSETISPVSRSNRELMEAVETSLNAQDVATAEALLAQLKAELETQKNAN